MKRVKVEWEEGKFYVAAFLRRRARWMKKKQVSALRNKWFEELQEEPVHKQKSCWRLSVTAKEVETKKKSGNGTEKRDCERTREGSVCWVRKAENQRVLPIAIVLVMLSWDRIVDMLEGSLGCRKRWNLCPP